MGRALMSLYDDLEEEKALLLECMQALETTGFVKTTRLCELMIRVQRILILDKMVRAKRLLEASCPGKR